MKMIYLHRKRSQRQHHQKLREQFAEGRGQRLNPELDKAKEQYGCVQQHELDNLQEPPGPDGGEQQALPHVPGQLDVHRDREEQSGEDPPHGVLRDGRVLRRPAGRVKALRRTVL
eukprot:CAMPEP_0168337018 /NCGR_PEP_ID=MMETSP0213-20121227/11905_1 /TAXON_ID=151035 /ORGANISM="Euplotes harpa, Strain FSP1.4" /LENGTH=114 /DNA_ID=CAMNT_0008342357 /DNA_START=87 /DNA_END=431 /DNA_ORIENTATION=+